MKKNYVIVLTSLLFSSVCFSDTDYSSDYSQEIKDSIKNLPGIWDVSIIETCTYDWSSIGAGIKTYDNSKEVTWILNGYELVENGFKPGTYKAVVTGTQSSENSEALTILYIAYSFGTERIETYDYNLNSFTEPVGGRGSSFEPAKPDFYLSSTISSDKFTGTVPATEENCSGSITGVKTTNNQAKSKIIPTFDSTNNELFIPSAMVNGEPFNNAKLILNLDGTWSIK